ncbi:IclR family transcriptional regulator [Microbacterium sp. XT11]|uniref:IclR family transcriptional regulator n=1 Tax=Microbacterium sp. XT11 TaxID=367477 RepID=UPI00083012CB|nr:IclR family transcriptional regulator [Microbacterium sp. XT11]
MTAPKREQTLIGSVQRALSLVDIVANSARPVPVKALATAAGLTPGTTYNLVRTLVHEGYLQNEPDGVVLGSRFPGFAAGSDSRGVFLARVREALNTASDRTGVTAYLSRYSDGEVHLVDIVDARRSPRVELWVGVHDSAHATALGKQILAELPLEDRLDYLSRHPLGELTPHTISDRRALLTQLERGGDWMLDREEYAIGHTCIAVPVSAPGVTASLAVSVPTERGDVDVPGVVRQLRDVAGRLSLQLGAERFGQFPI